MNSVRKTPPPAAVEAAGTNSAFHHEVETLAPPTAIWRLWTDVTTWPSWDTELESVRLDAAFGPGVTGTLKGKGSPEAAFGGWLMSGFLGGSYRKALPAVMEKIRALAEESS
ncbi:MAG: hypothetical protein Q8S33_32450 [Myxococcales bacterium]|nr:hypothetical protein [Myxococcales bacterium]